MFIVIITIHVFIIIAAIVITFDVYWGGDWLGLGGTRREPEAMSSEGQDREPRLNDDVLNSAIVIILRSCWWMMINTTILMIMMMYACAFSHRIPLKHKGCLSCGAYRRQLRLTLSDIGFGSFFQSSHNGQGFFFKKLFKLFANACAGLYCSADHKIGFFFNCFDLTRFVCFVGYPVGSLLTTKLLAFPASSAGVGRLAVVWYKKWEVVAR